MLIAAHGNSLRALVKYLDNVSDEEIVELNIPTGIPLVYLLNDDLKPLQKFYLGDPGGGEGSGRGGRESGEGDVAVHGTGRRRVGPSSERGIRTRNGSCYSTVSFAPRPRRCAATGGIGGRWSSGRTTAARAAGGPAS